jgi:hypothetical protein
LSPCQRRARPRPCGRKNQWRRLVPSNLGRVHGTRQRRAGSSETTARQSTPTLTIALRTEARLRCARDRAQIGRLGFEVVEVLGRR